MTTTPSFSRSIGALVSGTLILGALLGPASTSAAQEDPAPEDCPEVMPVEEVEDGMVATGWTVSRGEEAEPFSVEILGVLPNALGPGRAMIVGDVSGDAIEDAGGIWSGMSGSPIYVDDRILGAIAFGLAEEGPTTVAGITPAEDMVDLLSYPEGDDDEEAERAGRVTLSRSMRRTISEDTSSQGRAMNALKMPLSISAGAHAMEPVERAIERERLPLIAYAGASAAQDQPGDGSELDPGESFAASFSYGAVTVAEIGTVTMICDAKAIAFGHAVFPFFPEGDVEMGANAADVIAIVENPNFKLATVEEQVGVVDQDRLAGIRALLGDAPPTVPITSTVTAEDIGRTRITETQVAVQSMVPQIAQIHMVDSVDSAFDQVGPGTVRATWTITGTTASGEPWDLTRTNLFSSGDDVARASFREMTGHLYTLFYQPFEEVSFTGIDATISVEEEVELLTIVGAETSINGGEYRSRNRIRVKPGVELGVRVLLRPADAFEEPTPDDEQDDVTVDLQLTVPPKGTRDALISLKGGPRGGGGFCFYDGEACARRIASRVSSLEELIELFETKPPRNSVQGQLQRRGFRMSDVEIVDQAVSGSHRIAVIIGARDQDDDEEPREPRPTYRNRRRG